MDLPIHISDWPGNLCVQSIGINLKSEAVNRRTQGLKMMKKYRDTSGAMIKLFFTHSGLE